MQREHIVQLQRNIKQQEKLPDLTSDHFTVGHGEFLLGHGGDHVRRRVQLERSQEPIGTRAAIEPLGFGKVQR